MFLIQLQLDKNLLTYCYDLLDRFFCNNMTSFIEYYFK